MSGYSSLKYGGHFALLVILTGWLATPAALADWNIDDSKVLDLTYAFDEDTIYWPTAKPFQREVVAAGETEAGYWYAANNICLAEHGGTHMDAPIHFAQGKRTAADVPVQQLIGPAVVIDVEAQASTNPDYRLSLADIEAWEQAHGRIPAGAIVLMYSGWGKRWPDKERYLGTDKPGDVAKLHFPSFSDEAAGSSSHSAGLTRLGWIRRVSTTASRRTSWSIGSFTAPTSRGWRMWPISTNCRRPGRC